MDAADQPSRSVGTKPTVVLVHGASFDEHRTIAGGIGHDLPHEAPQAFTQAVVDAASY